MSSLTRDLRDNTDQSPTPRRSRERKPDALADEAIEGLKAASTDCPFCTAAGRKGEGEGAFRETGAVADTLPPQPHKVYAIKCDTCDFEVVSKTRDGAFAEWNTTLEIANSLLVIFLKRESRAQQTTRPAAEAKRGEHAKGHALTAASAAGGSKSAGFKPPLHLINRTALVREAEALAFGAQKHGPWNWAEGLSWADVARAAIGHLYAFLARDDIDATTGLSHLAHARCEVGFLLEFDEFGTGIDDRRPLPKKQLAETDETGDADGPGDSA